MTTAESVAPSRENAAFWTPARVGQAARSGALLATIGASIPLVLFEGFRRGIDGLLAENRLALPIRNRLLGSMVGTGVVVALVAWGFLVRKRSDQALDGVRRAARILAPLSLLCLVVPLFRVPPWQKNPLALCSAIGLVVVLAERTTETSLSSFPDRAWTWLRARTAPLVARVAPLSARLPFVLTCAGALAYGVLVSILQIRFHDRFGTAAFDLGGYDNIFFNALKGHPMRGTVAIPSGEEWSNLRVHAELSTYVLLPLYALRPRAETLLVLQAFVVGLGALPIYLFAARRIPRVAALLLAWAYLLFAPVQSGNFYDFHFQPLGSTLILWSFYLLDARKDAWFALVFAMALASREDVSITYVVAGVLMVAVGHRPKAGLVVAGVSVAYFGIIRFVVMPHFGSWWFQNMYQDLLPEGDGSLFGVAKTILSNPLFTLGTLLTQAKLLHVLQIFLPLAFLPLRRAWLWLGFAPAALGTILTTGYHPTTDTTFQYVFYWVPFLFIGAAVVLQQIGEQRGRIPQAAAVVAMALATLITSYQWGVVFQRTTFQSAWGHIDVGPLTPAEEEQLADLRELGKQLPPTASLAATEHEVPHFSNRIDVYTIRNEGPHHADYILYRTGPGDRRGSDEAIASGEYIPFAAQGVFRLMRRADLAVSGGAPSPSTKGEAPR
jgi:uncharacterized membrane protein